MMASPPVPDIILPLSSQKHDPAWKHCHMIKRGDRTHLRCMYCHKLFSGGGIHRIKEHLACQKGNASSCPKVTADVRRAMQQSLEGVVMRRRKKQKLAEEVKKLNPVKQPDIEAGQSEADMGLQLVAMPDSVEPEAVQLEKKEEAIPKTHERRRRRAAKASPLPVSTPWEGGLVRSNWGGTMENDQVQVAIGRFLYESGVPLDAVNSVHFQPMIDAIAAAGPGLKVPTYHDIRGWILKNSVKEMKATLEYCKESWVRTGCSILADEWTTEMDQTLINFMVYCPEGIMFLKSVDASQIVTSADALYELLKLVVEEVGVNNVLQVITNNTETHAIAGKKLTETFPSMFWMPCAARCVVAMLEDIEKLEPVSIIMEHAKSITRCIYNHAEGLNMLRRHTDGKDLLHPYGSPSETNFITLKTIASLKENLSNMVASQDWRNSSYSKKQPGAAMVDLICSPTFWSSVTSLVQLTEPLVRVLRMVDSYKRPAMGYIYMGLRHAKEVIKKVLKRKKDYMPYWNIIDWRWDKELSRPLHAAGFFLNPQFFYSIKGEVPNEIMSGMLDCIERLVPETKAQDKINKELALYKNATGDFGRKMAIRARHTLLPAEWWSTYGGGCPNLTRLAIHILSQTCSARGCERSHIPFEQMHSQRKNHLEHQRLNDLIYVQYNLRLQQRQLLKNKQSDPIAVDVIDVIEDWIMEKSELFTDEDDDSSWMDLMQPVAGSLPTESTIDDDDDPFTAGLDDGVLNVADDDDDDDDEEEEEEDDDDDEDEDEGDEEESTDDEILEDGGYHDVQNDIDLDHSTEDAPEHESSGSLDESGSDLCGDLYENKALEYHDLGILTPKFSKDIEASQQDTEITPSTETQHNVNEELSFSPHSLLPQYDDPQKSSSSKSEDSNSSTNNIDSHEYLEAIPSSVCPVQKSVDNLTSCATNCPMQKSVSNVTLSSATDCPMQKSVSNVTLSSVTDCPMQKSVSNVTLSSATDCPMQKSLSNATTSCATNCTVQKSVSSITASCASNSPMQKSVSNITPLCTTKLTDKSNAPVPKTKRPTVWGRTPARKNLSLESIEYCSEDESVIQKLETTKSDLEVKIAKEVQGNAMLQASLERRKEALHERRLALEQDVKRLQEQLQKERDLRASLEAGLMNMKPGHISLMSVMDHKMRADLEEVALAEADVINLKQMVFDLRGQLDQQIQQNYGSLCESCGQQQYVNRLLVQTGQPKYVDTPINTCHTEDSSRNEEAPCGPTDEDVGTQNMDIPFSQNRQPSGKQCPETKGQTSSKSLGTSNHSTGDVSSSNGSSVYSKGSIKIENIGFGAYHENLEDLNEDHADSLDRLSFEKQQLSSMSLNGGKSLGVNSPTEETSTTGANAAPSLSITSENYLFGMDLENTKRTIPDSSPPDKRPSQQHHPSAETSNGVKSVGSAISLSNEGQATLGRSAASKKSLPKPEDAPTTTSTSALTRLTNRLNFLKERRFQLVNELQNLGTGYSQDPARPPQRTNSR